MRIVAISDTHGLHEEMLRNFSIGEGDVLIHAGDISNIGTRKQIENSISFFHNMLQYFNNVVFIAGNHDRGFDPMFVETKNGTDHIKIYQEYELEDPNIRMEKPMWMLDMLDHMDKRIKYLENSETVIDGVKFWGSPITPNFYEQYWAFNRTRGDRIKTYWEKIPKDTNVLITHGPPYQVADQVPNGNMVGCEDLSDVVSYELNDIKLHVFGHIHSGYGTYQLKNALRKEWTAINASVCKETYDPTNEPIEFDL
jgi:Icc-related predicted phosphoesterase